MLFARCAFRIADNLGAGLLGKIVFSFVHYRCLLILELNPLDCRAHRVSAGGALIGVSAIGMPIERGVLRQQRIKRRALPAPAEP